MQIDVTAAEIVRGIPGSAWACPITYAVMRTMHRTTNKHGEVATLGHEVRIDNDTWLLPPVAVKFRRAFDQYQSVEPFTFVLRKS